MGENTAELVRKNFDVIAPRAIMFGADFYDRLFDRAPDVRSMFADEMAPQVLKLIQTLSTLVSHLDDPAALRPELLRLGAVHADIGAVPAQYGVVAEVLIDTLRAWLGEDFTAECEEAWVATISQVATVMQEGAGEAAA